MKGIAFLLLLATGCRSEVKEITNRGGKQPIACVDSIKGYGDGVRSCRDGSGTIWACGKLGDDFDCIPVATLVQQWNVTPIVEAPHVAN